MTKPIVAANGTALSILEIIHQDLATVERLLRTAMSHAERAPNGNYLIPAATLVDVHAALGRVNALKGGFHVAVEAAKAGDAQ